MSPATDAATSFDDLYTRPDWVRRINAMGDSVGGAEHIVALDAQALVDTAVASTGGLTDFGDFDGDWRARFDALVEDLNASAGLHVVGRLMFRQELLRGLRTRLALAKQLAEKPGIRDEQVVAPMVITGPPRSGTSILFELLHLDPNASGVLATQALHPVPFGGAGLPELLAMSECEQEFWADVQPEFATIHELRSDLPVECVTITIPGFSGGHWPMCANLPNWQPDFLATMDYHRVLLQTLQHGGPPMSWVLKTPMYLAFVDLVFMTYPDAWVIHTHRDPLKTVPSGASTLATVRWERSTTAELPDAAAPGMAEMLINLMHRRQKGEVSERIVDSHFKDLMADPAAAVEKLYGQMGRPFLPAHGDAIRDYIANKPKGKFGKHKYSPEQWGFDAADIRERCREYTDYYGIALEG